MIMSTTIFWMVINLKIKELAKSNLFIIFIIIALTYSLIFPAIGLKVKESGLLTPLTFLVMFASGLGVPFTKIKGSFKDFKSIIYAFLSVFLLFPAVVYVLFLIGNVAEGDIFVGGMILACQAGTLSSAIVLTMAAGGNVPLALIITIITNTVSAFITPAMLNFLLSAGQGAVFNVKDMIVKLVLVLILPVVLAQILRLFIKPYLEYINPYRKFLGKMVVIIFVLTGSAASSEQFGSNIHIVFFVLLFVIVVHGIMLTSAAIFSRVTGADRESRTAILFCSSQKTLPAGLMIWSTYFAQFSLAPIVIVSYHVVQLFIDSIIVNVLKEGKRGKTKK